MLKITMFSKADKVKGQGVGSAYIELINMLNERFKKEFLININTWNKADISHYHTVNFPFYLSTFFKKQRGVRIGYVHFLPETLKGSIELFAPFQKIFEWYVLDFYRRMDELVVVNPSFIPELVKAGCPEEKITYIPNFVSNTVFYEKTASEKEALRQKYGFSDTQFIVLGVGQIQKRKGLDDFIQLAKDNPDITFVWAGGFSFGKMTDGYEEYEKVYKHPPQNLIFPGIIEREELVDYYNLCDVFLLPSYNELFPMSILEAFNCGTPVMVRELELYQSVIKGYYIGCQDRSDMQEALRRFKNEPSLLDAFEEKSRQAARYYSKEHVAQIWYEYYTKMVETYRKSN
ncbi:glycosyltransferase family 4 protein [uncultured Enterococcus sp.]|uniref:glycosyltransferase family 4 protein n=1 Tax=uncultured Enterococcus sp. TaxID=167972 RepID=UPI0025DBA2DD|nr:glycosyltransferase family 4 protein [uncultured Enterococcus sp.]